MTRPLALVRSDPTPEEAVDIGVLMRAERNDPERWRRMWVAADKAKAICIPDAPRRTWWK